MSDGADTAAPATPPAATAGSLLKQARQAQGLHIAALAASMKVPQRKLEALEADRFDELPDATFTRALAQTVCRTLKIDPAPVLALLPKPPGHRLEHVSEGINAPFRERPGTAPGRDLSMMASPALWAPLLLIVAAAVVYFLPAGLIPLPTSEPAASSVTAVVPAAPPASAPDAPVAAAPVPPAAASSVAETVATPVVETAPPPAAAPAPASAPPMASSAPAPVAAAAGELQLRTVAESWIEVVDARGTTLMSRLVPGGETIALDGPAPLRLTIGNATGTQVTFRGKPVEMPATARDNVARLTLK